MTNQTIDSDFVLKGRNASYNGFTAVQVYREAVSVVELERSDTNKWDREYKQAVRAHAFGVLDALAYVLDEEEYSAVCAEHQKVLDLIDC